MTQKRKEWPQDTNIRRDFETHYVVPYRKGSSALISGKLINEALTLIYTVRYRLQEFVFNLKDDESCCNCPPNLKDQHDKTAPLNIAISLHWLQMGTLMVGKYHTYGDNILANVEQKVSFVVILCKPQMGCYFIGGGAKFLFKMSFARAYIWLPIASKYLDLLLARFILCGLVSLVVILCKPQMGCYLMQDHII